MKQKHLRDRTFAVISDLDSEIEDYCYDNGIDIDDDGTMITFSGSKVNLMRLRDKFFRKYSFDLNDTRRRSSKR